MGSGGIAPEYLSKFCSEIVTNDKGLPYQSSSVVLRQKISNNQNAETQNQDEHSSV
jgi:hypothetical protein